MTQLPGSSSALKVVAATVAVLFTSSQVGGETQQLISLSELLEDPNFSILKEAVVPTGLCSALSGVGPYTLFAPSDAAFEALDKSSPGTLTKWLKEEYPHASLSAVLRYHIARGATTLDDIINGTLSLTTLALEDVSLTPPTELSPTMVNTASITASDVPASNGIMHVIDQVLIPSSVEVLPGIFEAANATGQFSVLGDLIQMVGLEGQFSNPGPFTVFAPTDDAFAKLDNFDELTSDIGAVINILANHVIGGRGLTSDDLVDGLRLTTMVYGELKVSKVSVDGDSTIMIEDATVVQANIIGSNGVLHAIDTVIMPEAFSKDTPTTSPGTGGNAVPTNEPPNAMQADGASPLCSMTSLLLVAVVMPTMALPYAFFM